jgi:hypothetical protein
MNTCTLRYFDKKSNLIPIEAEYKSSFEYKGFTFVLHRPIYGGELKKTGWMISEKSTGSRICQRPWKTQKEALSEGIELLEREEKNNPGELERAVQRTLSRIEG